MITAKRISTSPLSFGIGIALLSFTLYLFTMPESLSWGMRGNGIDGGELLAASKTLGVPHPPGYPTYVVTLRLFATLIPIRDFAFRGNLLSALLASGTIYLLYTCTLRILTELTPSIPVRLAVPAAAMSALALAVSPLMWSLAIITEVYTLNTFFASLLILITLNTVFSQSKGTQPTKTLKIRLLAFGLIAGLGLGNHITLFAVSGPLAIWIAFSAGWILSSRWIGCASVVGLTIYFYLPVRAAKNPPINWGDADTFYGFLWMITGKPYQGYLINPDMGILMTRAIDWIELFFGQFNPVCIFFGVIGILSLRYVQMGLLFTFAISFSTISVFTLLYRTIDIQVLMLQGFLLFSLFVGIGFFMAISACEGVTKDWSRTKTIQQSRFRDYCMLWTPTILGFLIVPVITIVLNFSSQDLSGDHYAYNHGSSLFQAVPDGSLILADSEKDLFALWYMRYVDQPEKDVAVVSTRLLQYDWYLRNLHHLFPNRVPSNLNKNFSEAVAGLLAHNANSNGIYLTFRNLSLENKVNIQPVGPIFKVTSK